MRDETAGDTLGIPKQDVLCGSVRVLRRGIASSVEALKEATGNEIALRIDIALR